ncbi:MAG: glutamate-1-semialdehyde aminotransferase [Clostridium sp. SCN 57-10]|nr:MAG: glutamate-1-semialdehyde aminotransferase [Clostridium sp. SCN 57-10]
MMTKQSAEWFARAQRVLPGGVNSPVRAFRAVGGTPRFIASAKGAYLTDEDGNTYLDYVASWGPMLLGHRNERVEEAVLRACRDGLSFGAATALEVEMAELMCAMVPGLEMVRMVCSGTEAVMSALRLARGVTGREKIIKFVGCYHGHCDGMLVKAGSGLLTGGTPDSGGVTRGAAHEHAGDIAAVIVEPVAANMGVVPPEDGFLQGLRTLCTKHGALLVFDEVITGFRLAPGGAAQYFGVSPDLVVYGKIIGGGMPVGAYGGARALMEQVAPLGPVYQAGTLSGNPVAMAAGFATLSQLKGNSALYDGIAARGEALASGLSVALPGRTVTRVGSLVCPFFTGGGVASYAQACASDTARYGRYFHHMLEQGIYLAPAQFEAMFVGACHTDDDIARTVAAAEAFAG